ALHAGHHGGTDDLGRAGARNQHRTDDEVGLGDGFADGGGVGREREDAAAEQVIQLAQAGGAAVGDGHHGAGADRHLGGVGADDAAAEDEHARGRHAGHAAEQQAAAAVAALQVLGSHLHGQAPGHLAHGFEQRQAAARAFDGFVADGGDLALQQLFGQIGQRGEMEVGEQQQAGAEEAVLGLDRRLDLAGHLGAAPELLGGGDEFGALAAVLGVIEVGIVAGAVLDQHGMAEADQLADASGHQADAGFMILQFAGNADDHRNSSVPASVNLGVLQAAAEIHVHGLPFAVDIERGQAALAVAVAGAADAAEGKMDLGADGGGVDVDDAAVEVAQGAEGGVDVGGVERGGEAVGHAVGQGDGVLEPVAGEHRDHGAEDLLLRDAHGGLHAGEDGGFEEEAVRERAVGAAAAAEHELGALLPADGNVLLDALQLLGVDHRADLGAGLEAGSQVGPV